MVRDWYQEGVKAGKTDGWMALEETLKEDRERHPNYTEDPGSLVQTSIEGWEETDHFGIKYGSPMMDDAQEELDVGGVNDAVIEKWQDNKDQFWEGYIAGRKSIGKDIYAIARRLTKVAKKRTTRKYQKAAQRHRLSSGTSLGGIR